MATVRLTKTTIDKFAYAGGWDVRWDSVVPGLGLRVYPSGKKAFLVSYRVKGKKRRMVLGPYGVWTLDQARTKAKKLLVQVKDGADPLEEKRQATPGRTFGELVETYLERHAKVHKKTWAADERRLERNIPRSWKSRAAEAVTRQDVALLHDRIGRKAPYEANRLVEIIRVMYRHAPNWGFAVDPQDNPGRNIARFRERKRSRFLTPQEVPFLVAAIDEEPNNYVRAAIWLYLLTGLRKTELLEARWALIDWANARLRLPDTKSGDEQWATLSAPAIMVLQAIPRLPENPFILPGARVGAHFVNISKPWIRIRRAATVEFWAQHPDPQIASLVADLRRQVKTRPSYEVCRAFAEQAGIDLPTGLVDTRLHDLRRTVGSWMSQAATDLNTIREALRHASISTTLTYARLGADPARAALEAHGERLLQAAGRQRVIEVRPEAK